MVAAAAEHPRKVMPESEWDSYLTDETKGIDNVPSSTYPMPSVSLYCEPSNVTSTLVNSNNSSGSIDEIKLLEFSHEDIRNGEGIVVVGKGSAVEAETGVHSGSIYESIEYYGIDPTICPLEIEERRQWDRWRFIGGPLPRLVCYNVSYHHNECNIYYQHKNLVQLELRRLPNIKLYSVQQKAIRLLEKTTTAFMRARSRPVSSLQFNMRRNNLSMIEHMMVCLNIRVKEISFEFARRHSKRIDPSLSKDPSWYALNSHPNFSRQSKHPKHEIIGDLEFLTYVRHLQRGIENGATGHFNPPDLDLESNNTTGELGSLCTF